MNAPETGSSMASASPSKLKKLALMRAIAVLAFLGILVSSFSLYHHFVTSPTGFCRFGESFNCDLVNRSRYSIVLGLPVALIGVAGYFLILALATLYREKAETPLMLVIACSVGLGFSLYLTYVEGFVLAAWCLLCLGSLALICSSTGLSAAVLATSRSRN
jgi:uncharacterized membrane protein